MSKRKFAEPDFNEISEESIEILPKSSKKHTLDSDEDDSGDDERYNVMNDNDIEGEEEGVPQVDAGIKFTPFNMKEELEEGHFDREGHFQWDREKEIRDNWLDNIDWIKIKSDKKYIDKTNRGLADSSDSEDEGKTSFNELETYKNIFKLMEPGETIKKSLQRLGAITAKLSSADRYKMKKDGVVDENAKVVSKLTEMANDILTNMGNMDVYQETYETIQQKIGKKILTEASTHNDLDMYADDFDSKEKEKLVSTNEEKLNCVLWEYKWKQEDADIHGPFSSEQMQMWVDDGYFKGGIFVRKVGEGPNFYNSNRIDFELYI